MSESIKLRPSVQWFAEQMERKLRTHDADRGDLGWRRDAVHRLAARACDELVELADVLDPGSPNQIILKYLAKRVSELFWTDPNCDKTKAIDEAADVANFMMMVADVLQSGGKK